MRETDGEVIVSSVDYERHTMQLIVKGHPVTVICSPRSAPEVYEQIKEILIRAVLEPSERKETKIGQDT